jgi:hypothetical protein
MWVEAFTVVPAPPELVWQTLLRWEDQPRWMRDADSVRVVGSRREGVGVRIAVRTRVLSIPVFTERLEVTEWDPPRRLALAHRSVVRGTGIWTLEPARGGTRLRWTEDLELPVPILGELVLRAYRPLLRRVIRGSLGDLRASLLARGGSISPQAGESGAPG